MSVLPPRFAGFDKGITQTTRDQSVFGEILLVLIVSEQKIQTEKSQIDGYSPAVK